MEVMDTSLDKFYKLAFDNNKPIPEPVLGKIAVAVSTLPVDWNTLLGLYLSDSRFILFPQC